MSKYELKKININVWYGIGGGLLAILLMSMSIRISDSIIFDFRHITILVVATFGGLSSALITGSIIFIFRLFYLGLTLNSILIAFNMLIVSIGCGIMSKLKLNRWIKWTYMNIFASLMISISFWARIPDKKVAENTILIFCISSIIVGSIVYFVTSYILLSEKLFRKYKHEAKYDFLTGLKNIRAFNYSVENIEELLEDNCKNVSIFFIDIDFFKVINDTYGHEAGDIVLKEFGKVLKDLFRLSDMIFRVGGEEFVVILPNCKDNIAIEIAERIRSIFAQHTFCIKDNIKIKLAVSIGIASSPITTDNDNIKSLVTKADSALYKAKENGRNRVEVFQE
jgi:diguanylate cyclase (GGDEF) domain